MAGVGWCAGAAQVSLGLGQKWSHWGNDQYGSLRSEPGKSRDKIDKSSLFVVTFWLEGNLSMSRLG